MWFTVSSKGISVNREVTSKSNVFLIVCWCSAIGAKSLVKGFSCFIKVYVPQVLMIGRSLKLSVVIWLWSSNLWVFAVA